MRPATRAAVLLLLGAMFMSDSAAAPTAFLDELCKNPAQCEGMEGEGWFPLGEDRCVKAFNTTDLSFDDAEKACNQEISPNNFTAHLVSVHSKAELDQVVCAMYRATPSRPPYWIGLHLTFVYENNHIYEWTDGTSYWFDFWAYGQPNDEEQKCIEINFNYWGEWNDIHCSFTRPFVCAVKVF